MIETRRTSRYNLIRYDGCLTVQRRRDGAAIDRKGEAAKTLWGLDDMALHDALRTPATRAEFDADAEAAWLEKHVKTDHD